MDAPLVQYTTTSDGCKIAFTVSGQGPPLVLSPGLTFNHVQLSWSIPSAGSWLRALSSRFRVTAFDHRGTGMSTRGLGRDLEAADFELDIAAVMDKVGSSPVVLLACHSSVHPAVRYALRHGERIGALVLLGGGVSLSSSWVLTAGRNWEYFLETVSPPEGAAVSGLSLTMVQISSLRS